MQLHGKTKTKRTQYIAIMGLMVCVSIILSYVESLIPFSLGIPGIKLGLSNLCVLIALYFYGIKEAFIINFSRIVLSGFMFGSLSAILYSLSGAFMSMIFMAIFLHLKIFDIIGVSIVGGLMHNIGQCIVACLVVSEIRVFFYLPLLMVAGALTGFFIGVICKLLIPKINFIYMGK